MPSTVLTKIGVVMTDLVVTSAEHNQSMRLQNVKNVRKHKHVTTCKIASLALWYIGKDRIRLSGVSKNGCTYARQVISLPQTTFRPSERLTFDVHYRQNHRQECQ